MNFLSLILTFFLFTLPVHLNGKEAPTELLVQLDTENPRSPLEVSSWIYENAALSLGELKTLEQILAFDLNFNGRTYVQPLPIKGKKVLSSEDFDSFGSADLGDKLSSSPKLIVRLKNENLEAKLWQVNENKVKYFAGFSLSGNLNADRRTVHQLADTIHRTLFGEEGVASTKILYTVKQKETANAAKWTSVVWEMDYDGGNPRQVTGPESGYCLSPIYLPPKKGFSSGNFLYVSYLTGQPKLFAASLKEGKGHRLTTLSGNQLMPAISLQRDKIAFISDAAGGPDLFLLSFDPETGPLDKPRQVFAKAGATQGSPVFSPDGKKIAFVSNKDGSPRIYLIDTPKEGSLNKSPKTHLLTFHSKECTAPTWSPDGSKIAYCAQTKGIRQIWLYDLDLSTERQLTHGPGNKENPCFAPNSLHLVYNTTDADKCELYILNLSQTEAVRISQGTGEKHFPNWEPKKI